MHRAAWAQVSYIRSVYLFGIRRNKTSGICPATFTKFISSLLHILHVLQIS